MHKEDVDKQSERPLQMICYGAPGTGKSFTIDSNVDDDNSIRITFHPDSDYASFVGAYKPTMASMPVRAFVGTVVHHAKNASDKLAYEQKIVYRYVPQAFLKAYTAAWKNYPANKPYFLIIEEINRGNCAQIFGDLFQLLDRNNSGSSSYPISADEDIRQYLNDFFGETASDTHPEYLTEDERNAIRDFELIKDNGNVVKTGESILNGSKLLLPPNLHIWGTMNTSDQSLFPIDSAFKRRWDWEYMPIVYNPTDKRTGQPIDWKFRVGDDLYSWGEFLEKINPEIYALTESSDKQMGYFFAKADHITGIISESVFLNKVLFYLWTDVLKDYAIDSKIFINPETNKPFAFTDFFEQANALAQFVAGLDLPKANDPINDKLSDAVAEKVNNKFSVTFNDGEKINTGTKSNIYIQALKKIGLEKAAETFDKKGYKLPLVTKEPVDTNNPTRRYQEVDGWHILLGPDVHPYYRKLQILNSELNLGLVIERDETAD